MRILCSEARRPRRVFIVVQPCLIRARATQVSGPRDLQAALHADSKLNRRSNVAADVALPQRRGVHLNRCGIMFFILQQSTSCMRKDDDGPEWDCPSKGGRARTVIIPTGGTAWY